MNIVGVTSCPSGVAHTYMAAEALEQAAKKKSVGIKVETQGSSGIDGLLTSAEIAAADYVILTNDTNIRGTERFRGKKVVQLSASKIIDKADALINQLLKKN
ncbi:PTS fructose-like transporter subunit IIB [Oenococcus sicerae]|uniref:PTS fructose-like transporter subunit IIB n=1 Tax=Oenococcus sicerae TaxID=2203724 RepID=A0AAJ1VQW8_9LACO|nr:PTS fructose-like transporter subunit IIB [Oenococcus sicerae]MDN6900712.1 PTS fructose-like transporter subunit IIB [Oenococcus sicerae]